MSNVHIHLHVSDLEASRVFYERFFGGEPVKVKPGYVKFLPTFAPINLALSAGPAGAENTVDHLGFQVDSRDAVLAFRDRVKTAGIDVREEMDTNCCYANQDKFWVRDPDGVEWEVYHLNHDLDEDPATTSEAAACCPAPLSKIKLGRVRE
jgi:catechol 2,3-dioxygenase-like lactoylglutathione lyase family enzyme